MDIWTNHVYRTQSGRLLRVLDVFEHPQYGDPWVKWESAEVAVPHRGNGRRATSGFDPLEVFERIIAEEVAA